MRFILTGCCLVLLIFKASSSPGTTSNIEDTFKKRCEDYLRPGSRIIQLNQPSVTDCEELWTKFSDAWIRRNPETITATDYLPFLNAAKQRDIENILLWSGTYDIAHKYACSMSYVTLEDTLIGYLVNGLTWCGINKGSCSDNAKDKFWEGASATFASSLKEEGSVVLMLKGSNASRVAFKESSYASKFELPNLPKSSSIRIILVYDKGRTQIERCTTGSLLTLTNTLNSLGFRSFECSENPPDVVALLNGDVPKECNSGTNSAPSVLKYLCLCIVFMFFTSL